VVTHDQDGLLFPSGDVEALTAALRRLLRDPVTARKMGQAGLTVVRDRFSLDRMAAAYESRYSALVADVGR
jgi:glycosyltransferase involved in cell wall biosynthesis